MALLTVKEEIKIIPYTDYYINTINGLIYKLDNNNLLELVKCGMHFEVTTNFGVRLNKDIEWYRWMAIYSLYLPDIIKNEIDNIIFVDQKPFGISRQYKKLPVFNHIVTRVINDKEYAISARFPFYAISKEGEFYSLLENKKHKLYNSKETAFAYTFVSVYDMVKMVNVMNSIHRLVALAWLENDDYVNKNIIDHIDNNKNNNHVSNLRWVTNRANQAKNYYSISSIGVKLLNVDTGEESVYESLQEACKAIGRTPLYALTARGLFEDGKLIYGKNGRFELKKLDDKTPWVFKNRKPFIIRLSVLENGNKIHYRDTRDFKLAHNLPKEYTYDDIKKYIDKQGYVILYERGVRKNTPMQIKNVITKNIINTDDTEEVTKIIGCKKGMIWKYLDKDKDNILINNEWLIRKPSNMLWADETDTIIPNDAFAISLTAVNINTNEHQIFPSFRSACRYFDKDGKTLKLYIRNNKILMRNNEEYKLTYTDGRIIQ